MSQPGSPTLPSAPSTRRQPPVLALFVEGLRAADISRTATPFLHALRDRALLAVQLETSPGTHAWSEVFSGARPDRTGVLGGWTLGPASDLPLSPLSALWNQFRDGAVRAKQRHGPVGAGGGDWAGASAFGRCGRPPHQAPRGLRSRLFAADDPELFLREGRAPYPTLLDVALARGRKVETSAFPLSERDERRWVTRLGSMMRSYLEGSDAYFAHLPGGARLVRDHGPNSPERPQILRELDTLVERLAQRFRQQFADGNIVLVSVCGSVGGRTYFDAAGRVERLAAAQGVSLYRDFALLTDRTLVRGWALSPRGRAFFAELFASDRQLRRHGVELSPPEAARERLPPPGGSAGDWLWFAHPGVIVFPNDLDRLRPAAAAGYYHEAIPARPEPEDAPPPPRVRDLPPAPPKTAVPVATVRGGVAETDPLELARHLHEMDRGLLLVAGAARNPHTPVELGLAHRTDVCATIAALMGVDAPAGCEGANLLPSRSQPD